MYPVVTGVPSARAVAVPVCVKVKLALRSKLVLPLTHATGVVSSLFAGMVGSFASSSTGSLALVSVGIFASGIVGNCAVGSRELPFKVARPFAAPRHPSNGHNASALYREGGKDYERHPLCTI